MTLQTGFFPLMMHSETYIIRVLGVTFVNLNQVAVPPMCPAFNPLTLFGFKSSGYSCLSHQTAELPALNNNRSSNGHHRTTSLWLSTRVSWLTSTPRRMRSPRTLRQRQGGTRKTAGHAPLTASVVAVHTASRARPLPRLPRPIQQSKCRPQHAVTTRTCAL